MNRFHNITLQAILLGALVALTLSAVAANPCEEPTLRESGSGEAQRDRPEIARARGLASAARTKR